MNECKPLHRGNNNDYYSATRHAPFENEYTHPAYGGDNVRMVDTG